MSFQRVEEERVLNVRVIMGGGKVQTEKESESMVFKIE